WSLPCTAKAIGGPNLKGGLGEGFPPSLWGTASGASVIGAEPLEAERLGVRVPPGLQFQTLWSLPCTAKAIGGPNLKGGSILFYRSEFGTLLVLMTQAI
ncbi:MAG: hypothetical protein QMD66_07075, partial [Actinomycetota bacterium]|nr:hypothetical protein [Actinomycetota bacterium]